MEFDPKNLNESEWQERLTEEEYRILRQAGTEPPFTGTYHDCKEKGTYRCTACDAPLFSSDTKFESRSGWPSFWNVADTASISYHDDTSLGMIRTAVHCANCDSHLGHVFDDGPPPTGKRYCINSIALQLDKD